MTFQEYCLKKKIDPELFQKSDPSRYQEWERIFDQVHPDSFTEQKKFLINETRRKYLLKEKDTAQAPEAEKPKTAARPVFKPKLQ
jgi:hypothetical protein